ncbi:heat shock protein transcriptional repressor HspR [Cellulomonas marina]|uniref:MerR family transcriptional regulator, heat shock protein HspR n=1 Tax=Cellulomonas marina TaxID=988821 RepID=A0A1I1A417_9CELL|nr:MerR family transcriptional regulator [Cellulomonas marina]GIG30790.1 transcriptional regulator [Cellulomonas marina]SFB32709.1 MerR family transcriptional regulator, heat shock protein HspR [Cellulomonas marina]
MDENARVFVISVAAELAGMHPQTLRQYDRLGLVQPGRTRGRGRRYSLRDIATLREVQRLSQEEGINLAGIKRILALQGEVERLQAQVDFLRGLTESGRRVFTAHPTGDVVAVRRGSRRTRSATDLSVGRSEEGALVLWRPGARDR